MNLDIHIIQHPTQDRSEQHQRIIQQCESMGAAVHTVPGVHKHIGKGRAAGFDCGESEFVTFVDDDDEIIQAGAVAAYNMLANDSSLQGVATSEYVNDRLQVAPLQDGEIIEAGQANLIHHLLILRRTCVEHYLELLGRCPDLCEYAMICAMLLDGKRIAYSRQPAYRWNTHEGCARRLKIEPTKEALALMQRALRNDKEKDLK